MPLKTAVAVLLAVVAATTAGVPDAAAPADGPCNVILMVPDGMGLADVTAARIFQGGEDGPPLALETLPHIGHQRTYSANSTITDSAAAASAWATGFKHRNGDISWLPTNPAPTTVLEIAKRKGKATGLVATSTITHATPAAFAAHVSARSAEGEIARQYIEVTQPDLLLGGHFGPNGKGEPFPAVDRDALVTAAVGSHGYALATNRTGLAAAVSNGAARVLGLFAEAEKTRELFRVDPRQAYPPGEPTLAELATAALTVLSRDPDGFFLLVEGSQVDWANHVNDEAGQVAEVLGFDAAVRAVLDWIRAEPARAARTLLIVVADHETGGFALTEPYGKRSPAGQILEGEWTTKKHTGVDTIIWSQGPGSEQLNRALDNTDLFDVMKQVIE